MQNIPIIISEKVLKKVFIEVVDEINKFCIYKYEIIDQYIKNIQNSSAIIMDLKALESIDVPEIKNQKLFIINDNSKNTSVSHSNQTLINTPFKIYDLFVLVDNNIAQTKRLEQQKIKFNEHIFDPIGRILHKGQKFIRLTEKECEIFISLVENEKSHLSKKFLLKKVWQYNQEIDTHTLETHLYSLRKKIDDSLGTKNLIIYEEKKGYSINRELL